MREKPSAGVPGDFLDAVAADAHPAVGLFDAFFFFPTAGGAAHFDIQRGEGGIGARQVVGPRGGVAVQHQAVPFAHGFRQPGDRDAPCGAFIGLAFLLPGAAGTDGFAQPAGDGVVIGVLQVNLDIGLAHGGSRKF